MKAGDDLMDFEELGLSLEDILKDVTPSVVTPNLNKFMDIKNDKKPRTLADIIVDHKMKTLTNPTTKEISHDGKIYKIKFFDITPLKRGVWCEMSIMLLNLSYNEQCQVIDALYPDDLKLTAKAFAINFTNQEKDPVQIVEDKDIHDKLDGTNVGIAMILAMLASGGMARAAHPDIIKHYLNDIREIASAHKEAENFKRMSNNSDARFSFRDRN